MALALAREASPLQEESQEMPSDSTSQPAKPSAVIEA
jgi:hypothetical protein